MQEKYSNAFLGFGPEDKNFALELTKNYGKDSYDLGTGFGHFALALPDVYKACESIKKAGNTLYDHLQCHHTAVGRPRCAVLCYQAYTYVCRVTLIHAIVPCIMIKHHFS